MVRKLQYGATAVRLRSSFDRFLRDYVNIDPTRLDLLQEHVDANNEEPTMGRTGGGVGTSGIGAGGAVGLRKGLTVKVESVSGAQLVVKTIAGSTVPGVTKTVLAGSARLRENSRPAPLTALRSGETLLLKGGARNSAGGIVPATITIQP